MMWNFGGEKADSNKLRMPSPSFPVAQHFTGPGPMHSSSSHIGGANFPATYISPAPEPYNQVPRAAFPQHGSGPQIIHIYTKKHHSSHSHHQHRPHRSHSHPPPITYPVPQIAVAQPDHHQIVHHTPSRPVQSNSRPPKSNYLVPAQAPPELNSDFQYSKCTGRKKALCVGINYIGQPNALRGCINDARHVRDFLIQKEGYKAGDIVLLTDDAKNPRDIPTRKNILDAMAWLVRSARTNDSLFFHYSGHGGQTKDKDGDETDGFDEVIFPLDFKKAGHIVDDLMHEIMVKPLPPGCRLTALFDSCHSGTVLDLPYIYSSHGRLRGGHVSNKSHAQKATRADVISWSGCKDGQTSADTFAGGVAVGAMSYAFITALTRQPNQTYQQLLRSIRLILYPKFEQKPQLGSSHHINTNLQFII